MDDQQKITTRWMEELSALQQALRREEALGRIRRRIIAMRHPDELGRELETAWREELIGLGIPVEGVSLQTPSEGDWFCCQNIFRRNAPISIPLKLHLRLEESPWVKEAWESGKPVVVDRARMDQFERFFATETQSLLEVPLPGVGSIGLNSLDPAAFGPEAVHTVQLFVVLIAEGMQRLQELEARAQESQIYRSIVDTAIDGIITIDQQGCIVSFNPAAAQIFGYAAVEVLGRNLSMLVPEPYCSEHDAYLDHQRQTGEMMAIGIGREVLGRRKDGTIFPAELSVSELVQGGQRMFTGIIRDITVHKQKEERLRQHEERYRTILQTAMDGFWVVDFQGRFLEVNEAYCRMSGYSRQELLAMSIPDLEVVESAAETAAHTKRVMEQGSDRFESKHRCQDGSIIDVEVNVQYQRALGEVLVCFLRDITKIKQVQTRLRDEQKRLRTILDTVGDPIFVKDNDHRIILANEAFYGMFGLDEAAVIGFTLAENVPADEREQFLAVDRRVLDTGLADLREESLTVNGLARTIVTRKTRFVEGSGARFLVGSIHDMTERKKLEQERVQTQRLRAVGELSAGICHNLNNILTGVLAPAELLQMTSNDPKAKQLSGMVIEAGTRAVELVHRLHISVRQGAKTRVTAVALNPLIEGVIQLTRPKWQDEPEAKGRTIEVRTALATVPPIKGDPSEVHDLLTNLLFNAVDALPQGGLITVETADEGDLVRLDFSDTGIGMDEATRTRIFEPFFTTKMEVGTGLGLSTLYNSVTQWGGAVAVASSPGRGTTFTLRLPVWHEVEPAPLPPSAAVASRPGRVLVVEDDQVIGRILSEVLSVGHHVEVFTDGREALAQFSIGKFDVVILDLGIPGISGDQVAKRIQELDPAAARILLSGWVLESTDPRSKLFDFALQKPLRDLQGFTETVARAIVLRDQRTGVAG